MGDDPCTWRRGGLSETNISCRYTTRTLGGATGVPLKRMYFSAKKTAVKEIEEEVEEAPPEVDSECGSDRDC